MVNLQSFFIESGAEGSRTPVQTRKQYAFSMLSLDLVFERQLAQGHRLSS